MAKIYFESKEAKCPFYLHERQQVICCESVIPNAVTHLTFPHIALQRAHQAEYCNTMRYDNCPQCKAVMRRYEDEDRELLSQSDHTNAGE